MTVYKLEKFPFVCRMCLTASTGKDAVPLSEEDVAFDGSMLDFITSITFEISEEKAPFLPQTACRNCWELLKFFAKFRTKLFTIQLLINSLIELKRSNPVPIRDLFENKQELLKILFKDLDICNKDEVLVDDLLNEFPTYCIAKMSKSDKEAAVLNEKQTIEELAVFPEAIYAEECTPAEIAELIQEPADKPKRTIKISTRFQKGANTVVPDNRKWLDELLGSDSDELNISDSIDPDTVVRTYGGKKRDKPLKCKKCTYSSYYLASIRSHQLTHLKKEKKRHQCKHLGCTEEFKTARLCNNHYNQVHKPFVCETCGSRFPGLCALSRHRERHLNEKKYRCDYCGKGHNTSDDLRLHINIQHNAAYLFPCDVCGLEFKRKDILNSHQKIHSDAKDYQCDVCDKQFKKVCSLNRHRKTVHEKVRVACEHCDEMFPRRTKLRDHIEYVHGIRSRFNCDICLQLFDSQETLDVHKKRHENPKDLECGVCLALFASPEMMKKHLCISYRDDYICCGRDHRYHYPYNKHMLIKHGIKTNVRVKPVPGQLVGYLRAKRKRVETCSKCEAIFATRLLKRKHMEKCVGMTDDTENTALITAAQQSSNL
ncbi:zinc finger protein 431-like [Malaya genurostris]|uniref:zinc finger protein 431-like n=1 Tax=Malaya genurostris TaxID=325434 RepID=UPI0026F3998C|nr:zinc finger protein 431-like [Malaya genurostris]